jgi:hypothetical protein
MTIQEQFGQIDIYLFDQILRGNIAPRMRVLDAGCGGGRNLVYLLGCALDEGYEVFGVDADATAVASVRGDGFADVVTCNSVLHFARDEAQFDAMVRGLWRALRSGGMLFCRLGSTIGAGDGMAFEALGGGRFRMGHGAEWFLVDEAKLMDLTQRLGGELVDPLKTTVVQGQRCMTTWVVKKPGAEGRTLVAAGMPGLRA